MGVNIVNNMFGPHAPEGGSFTGYRYILVKGTAQAMVRLDESPDCTAAQKATLIAAAVTGQGAFNAAVASIFPNWIGGLSSSDLATMRTITLYA